VLEFLAVLLAPALAAALTWWLQHRRRKPKPRPPDQAALVLWKKQAGATRFLLVRTDSIKRERWVLPKTDIAPSETPADAARRLLGKEAGMAGILPDTPLTEISFDKDTQIHRVVVFLVVARQEGEPAETWRDPTWLTLDEALDRVDLNRQKGRHVANADALKRTLRQAASAVSHM